MDAVFYRNESDVFQALKNRKIRLYILLGIKKRALGGINASFETIACFEGQERQARDGFTGCWNRTCMIFLKKKSVKFSCAIWSLKL